MAVSAFVAAHASGAGIGGGIVGLGITTIQPSGMPPPRRVRSLLFLLLLFLLLLLRLMALENIVR